MPQSGCTLSCQQILPKVPGISNYLLLTLSMSTFIRKTLREHGIIAKVDTTANKVKNLYRIQDMCFHLSLMTTDWPRSCSESTEKVLRHFLYTLSTSRRFLKKCA